VLIGAGAIAIDETLARTGQLRLPPLAVGMGMYLPMSLTLVIPIGALLGRAYDRWAERRGGDVESAKRLGVLMATGLIVGESLFGVVFAGIVAASGSDAPLAVVGEGFANWALVLGVAVFVGTVLALYRRTRRAADQS
jgi:uncharacterized oligopeptide transporter (OPT) family protein